MQNPYSLIAISFEHIQTIRIGTKVETLSELHGFKPRLSTPARLSSREAPLPNESKPHGEVLIFSKNNIAAILERV
jgi:hypothetical protein